MNDVKKKKNNQTHGHGSVVIRSITTAQSFLSLESQSGSDRRSHLSDQCSLYFKPDAVENKR